MSIIYRGSLSNLWIKLQASETLGILDSDYLEDYFGNDGQVTLHHLPTGDNYPLVMAEVVSETVEIPHDVFRGMTALSGLPNGDFEVRARCRDIAMNYTIIGSVQNPYGGERVVSLPFTILPGTGANFNFQSDGLLAYAGFVGNPLSHTGFIGNTLGRPHL